MVNIKAIINFLGYLLLILGLAMTLCFVVALLRHENPTGFLISMAICFGGGILAIITTYQSQKDIGVREGFIIVTLGWILFATFGALPYLLSGAIPNYTDAFFETISGFTTTGATILNNIESLPYSILFWRSLTQWMGGMGFIVMTLAILPILGVGGMQLFFAETTGITQEKIHPRIKETAKRLWGIYIALTFVQVILLIFGDMTLFDAVCHSFTTMSTGGYSTKQASIAYYNSAYIQYVITLFMFIAGTNFALIYFFLKGKFYKFLESEEFWFYTFTVLGLTVITTLVLFFTNKYDLEPAFRHAFFQVVSVISTTGFITTNFSSWGHFLLLIIFLMMFLGGSVGSSAGGIKMVRIWVFFKNCYCEFKRILHPNAIIPVRLDNRALSNDLLTNVIGFIAAYLLIFVISTTVILALGVDFKLAIGSALSCLGNIGNIGSNFGNDSLTSTYSQIPSFGKWFLSFLMLVGRLELFTVLVLFAPSFWKK